MERNSLFFCNAGCKKEKSVTCIYPHPHRITSHQSNSWSSAQCDMLLIYLTKDVLEENTRKPVMEKSLHAEIFLISATYLKAWMSIHFKGNHAFSHGSCRKLVLPVNPPYCTGFLLWKSAYCVNVYFWIVLKVFHVLN